jgi:hypothetical protein
MIQQNLKIEKYHLDKARLNDLLVADFGQSGFEIEVGRLHVLT